MKEWIVYHFADGCEYYLDATLNVDPPPMVVASHRLLVFDFPALAEGAEGTTEVTHAIAHLERIERYRGNIVDESCIVTCVTAY